jgi:hypothetical protein
LTSVDFAKKAPEKVREWAMKLGIEACDADSFVKWKLSGKLLLAAAERGEMINKFGQPF